MIKVLEEIEENIISWFWNNQMKPNIDKCHLLLNNQEPDAFTIGDLHIHNSLSDKLLRINFNC